MVTEWVAEHIYAEHALAAFYNICGLVKMVGNLFLLFILFRDQKQQGSHLSIILPLVIVFLSVSCVAILCHCSGWFGTRCIMIVESVKCRTDDKLCISRNEITH